MIDEDPWQGPATSVCAYTTWVCAGACMHMCARTQSPTRAPNAFYLENFSTSHRFPVNHLPRLCPAIYLFVVLLMLINIICNSLYSNQIAWDFSISSAFFLCWVTWASRHWCQIYPPKDRLFEAKLEAERLEHFWLCLSLVVFKAPTVKMRI